MSDEEFVDQSEEIARRLPRLADTQRVAAACRGSGNPAALAWVVEALEVEAGDRLIDLGGGLGGPATWIERRYGCEVVLVEPDTTPLAAARRLFDSTVVCCDGAGLPFRSGGFDVALAFGVLSVVPRPADALTEARRIAGSLGVIDYCATGDGPVEAGGSTFVTQSALRQMILDAGWAQLEVAAQLMPAPRAWRCAVDSLDVPPVASEQEVIEAIERGVIAPMAVVAVR